MTSPGRDAVILVVDDDPRVGTSIQRMLVAAGYPQPAMIHDASELDHALDEVEPHLVLLDIHLGAGASGLDLAAAVPPHVAIIFLSGDTEASTLAAAGLRRPAGFVVKPFTPEQLWAAVEMAIAQRRPFAAEPIDVSTLPELAALSEREREVVNHLLGHKRAPAIAKALFISPHTVRNHLKHIFAKLGVRSQQELLDRITALASEAARAPSRARG